MIGKWFDVDLGNQIDNTWNKDSALALRKGDISYSIRIKNKDKKELKKNFIWENSSKANQKHNRKVIVIIYCFMLFKLLKLVEEGIRKIKLCRDVGPDSAVNRYLSKICRYYHEKPLTERFRIKFRKAVERKSEAHRLARDVARGRKKEGYYINKKDIEELNDILRKIL